jgi:hypothetical protein
MANEKIYVVTQGCYSDYHIVAATLDKTIAEKIAAKFSTKWEKCEIEEYGDAEVMLKPAWMIYFDRTGLVESTRECDCAYDYSTIGECLETNNIYTSFHIRVTVSADDLDSAIKIAAEKRAKYLAEKLGL